MDFKGNMKRTKKTEAIEVVSGAGKPGRPVQYNEGNRKGLNIKVYESTLDALKKYAADEFSGNQTMAINEILESFLKSKGYL